jgi:hypothetical protein
MEVYFEEEVEVVVTCPHCNREFVTMTMACGMTEVESPDYSWRD